MTTKPRNLTKAERKRERVEAAKVALARAQRRRRNLRLALASAAAVALIAAVTVAVVVLRGSKTAPPSAAGTTAAATSAAPTAVPGRASAPPWPAPANPSHLVAAAGLPMLGEEGTALHIHTHLDVIVDGEPVAVPAQIGIDESTRQISPLHTHDTTGVIHIESPTQTQFTLGQFFTEWQVSLSATNIGGLTADQTRLFKTYINGKPYTGNPVGIVLTAHDEIALVYGTADQQNNPPAGYTFPSGD
jgi:hypothetical protein